MTDTEKLAKIQLAHKLLDRTEEIIKSWIPGGPGSSFKTIGSEGKEG